ncbi:MULTISPECIES: GNAT family N-acetyltransferase [Micromonospora]|uniref:N-acetyltransferase n=1 Tax=Micromonospora sicca TaxID=2202420 RepID=A0A317DQA9_9ACTN|nr:MULTISPECIES: GNAT family N-acetyltransferase [unclassified Micromonospora]MBM0226998.1 GNAT family N-acetyltransferase [Micromonospora sp. ATA51]PWR16270.1 N-acetyltransferase [Micromonospora sp. 4G51]
MTTGNPTGARRTEAGRPTSDAETGVAAGKLRVGGADVELSARLERELTAYNNAATGAEDEADLSVRVTGPDGELVGGLTGWTWGGRAGVNTLWVRADRRHQDWGGRMLRAAEEEARRRGCTEVSLSSFSFQAPDFYRRHGYSDTGIRDGIPGGHVDHHFWKSLVHDPAAAVRLVALVEFGADAVEAGQRYEDTVLALLGRHDGRLERRLRTVDGRSEVHVIRFATRAGYGSFLADPERAAQRAVLGDAAPVTRVLEVRDV